MDGKKIGYLELYSFKSSSDKEKITLFDWSVCISKVGNQECLGQVSSNAFYSIVNGKNVNFSQIGNVGSWFNSNDI